MKQSRRLCALTALFFLLISSRDVNGQWIRSNDITGGMVSSIAGYDQAVYVIQNYSTVYKSSAAGIPWEGTGFTGSGYQLNGSYADQSGIYIADELGLFRSADGGGTWARVLNAGRINRLTGTGTTLWACGDGKAYSSPDFGNTWNSVTVDPSPTGFRSILATSSSVFIGSYNGKIYRTTDNGQNWSIVWTGWHTAPAGSLYESITSILSKGDTIFASTAFGWVISSSNNGDSWSEVRLPGTDSQVYTVAVSGGKIFAGVNDGVDVSEDNGTTWNRFGAVISQQVTALFVRSDTLYAGTHGSGVYRSSITSPGWNPWNAGLYCTRLTPNGGFAAASNPVGVESIFAAVVGAGLYASWDQGNSWSFTGIQDPWIVRASGNSAYVVDLNKGVSVSNDYGVTWTQTGMTSSGINALAVHDAVLYAGIWVYSPPQQSIFRSDDNGTTWQDVTNGITNLQVDAIDFNDSLVVVGSWGGGVGLHISNDNGNTWTPAATGLPTDTVQAVAVLKRNTSAYLFASVWSRGVYRSTDNGSHWYPANTGLSSANIYWFIVGDSSVYAQSDSAVFVTRDNGVTWSPIAIGNIEADVISGIAITRTNAYIAFQRRGIFRQSLSTLEGIRRLSRTGIPASFELSQNYPNPFNPSTTIGFSVPQTSMVSLKIFDGIGREIATLVSARLNPGRYEYVWDASDRPSGVYFYTLTTGAVSLARKFVILK